MRATIATALLLAACQREPVESAVPQAAGPCEAAAVQDLIGRPVGEVRDEAQRRSGAKAVRVYGSGSAVTMDYRPDRLNIEHDDRNAIVKLSCG